MHYNADIVDPASKKPLEPLSAARVPPRGRGCYGGWGCRLPNWRPAIGHMPQSVLLLPKGWRMPPRSPALSLLLRLGWCSPSMPINTQTCLISRTNNSICCAYCAPIGVTSIGAPLVVETARFLHHTVMRLGCDSARLGRVRIAFPDLLAPAQSSAGWGYLFGCLDWPPPHLRICADSSRR
jgi:hypothetical protein